jgi:Mrp family chromosome partitioning ATPase/capsular polysaccharide biosynthesis protein
MELVHYFRVLRRRWRMIFALTVVGALIGLGSLLLTKNDPTVSYYAAKQTLTSSSNTQNLATLAALTTTGEVPKRVADRLGGSPAALSAQVVANARTDIGLLEITAVGTDPKRTEQLANTFGEELMKYTSDLAQKKRDSAVAALQQQEDDLKNQYTTVFQEAQTAPASQQDFLKAQKDSLISQAKNLEDQIATSKKAPVEAPTLAITSTAEAVPYSGPAVAKLFEDKANGTGNSKNNSSSGNTSSTAPSLDQVGTDFSTQSKYGPATRAALGGLAGLILGGVLALVIDRLDPRIRTKLDAEEAFGFPVITELPMFTRRQQRETSVLAYELPRSRAAEAFRVLRSAVLFTGGTVNATGVDTAKANGNGSHASGNGSGDASGNGSGAGADNGAGTDHASDDGSAEPTKPERVPARVVMISSPGPSEGKTTTVANLAAIMGEAGYSVLVINCDFRRPRLREYLGGDDDPQQDVPAEVPNVRLIAQVLDHSADANPADIVAAQRKAITEARAEYDIILLDTAPLLTTNDAADVLSMADQVLVVARSGRTTKEAADLAAELLERRNAPVIGVVLVGSTEGPGGRYYYYGGKSYYLDDQGRRTPEEDKPLFEWSDSSSTS